MIMDVLSIGNLKKIKDGQKQIDIVVDYMWFKNIYQTFRFFKKHMFDLYKWYKIINEKYNERYFWYKK